MFLLNLEQLEEVAKNLALTFQPPLCIALSGDLGTGKTTFARAFIRAYCQDELLFVPSPTFTLLHQYHAPNGVLLMHSDLYRLNAPQEIFELGIPFENAITLIEWPEKAQHYLPRHTMFIRFRWVNENAREIIFGA